MPNENDFINPDRKDLTTNKIDQFTSGEIRERRPDETVKKVLVKVNTLNGDQETIEQDHFEEPFLLYEINELKRNINSLGYFIKETNDPDDPKVKEYLRLCEAHIKQLEDWIHHYEQILNKDGSKVRKMLEEMKELLEKVQIYHI